jgi:uridine phosphorylase
VPKGDPPYFILIDRAFRDEGTSYHYMPPSDYAELDPGLCDRLQDAFAVSEEPVYTGATWTTDAPFRETPTSIEAARLEAVLAVEMEAAALYAFAGARHKPVVCFAHVTNQMATVEGDFEKGAFAGSTTSLDVIKTAATALL